MCRARLGPRSTSVSRLLAVVHRVVSLSQFEQQTSVLLSDLMFAAYTSRMVRIQSLVVCSAGSLFPEVILVRGFLVAFTSFPCRVMNSWMYGRIDV